MTKVPVIMFQYFLTLPIQIDGNMAITHILILFTFYSVWTNVQHHNVSIADSETLLRIIAVIF